MTRILLKGGADPNFEGAFGMSPMSVAAANGHEGTVKLLFETGVDPDARDSSGFCALLDAAAYHHTRMVKLLLDWNSDPNTMDYKCRTLLYWTIWNENEEMMELLLQKGAVASELESGKGLLSDAAERGFAGGVRLLLEGGSNPDSKDQDGRSPLSWAGTGGEELPRRCKHEEREYAQVVKLLLEAGVEPDSKSNCGRIPLSFAVALSSDCEQIVQLLLQSGKVGPDSKDDCGRTPLSRAAETDNEVIVRVLLEMGADPDS